MSILFRVKQLEQLWALLLPTCPIPDQPQLGRWASRFRDEELEYAVNRTAQKFRLGMPSESNAVARYVSSVLNNERLAKQVIGVSVDNANIGGA
jgi:hypothetical protein